MLASPLLTDFYQLTMAYGYWKLQMHEQEAVFHLLFRKNPFKGEFALACGLNSVIDFLNQWHFEADDLAYLATVTNGTNKPIFPPEFLDYLSQLKFTCDIDAIPEGTIIFPHEPLLRIQGPLLQCQLLESPLLNMMNFQTLIATKAARVCHAAKKDPVIEFGLRRAQGPDGALSASRAAYIGGCVATSNALAGKIYDIPVRGTHAHSWVTAFANEADAFAAYASVLPHHCVLLVDTYNTIQGVKNAIKIGKKLQQENAELLAIRLDSGDMADLSIKARKLLDDAGLKNTGILASNSLDEYVIENYKQSGAQFSSWGVGTHLATAYDQPALDGVYKMGALQNKQGEWEYKLKLSEQAVKISNPGRHQVRRFFCGEQYVTDVIYDLSLGISDSPEAIILNHEHHHKTLNDVDAFVDLLAPIFKRGKLVYTQESIHQTRQAAIDACKFFYDMQQKNYPVGLEKKLFELKQTLVKSVSK